MSPPNSQSSDSYENGNQIGEVVYDRNSIISWLSTVDPLVNASPPGRSSRKRQRSEQEDFERKQPRSAKRRTGRSEQYSIDITEGEEETMSADLINHLRNTNPPFKFRRPKIKDTYPGHVFALLEYMGQMREDVIPRGLKDRIKATDLAASIIPPQCYSTEATTPEGLDRIWEAAKEVFRWAHTASEYLKDKNAWKRIVDRVISWNSVAGVDFFDVENIQAQTIQRSFLPELGPGITISRKIDFALCFSIDHKEVEPYYQKLCYEAPCYSLSHMSDTATSRMSFFCGLEVNAQRDAKPDDALAQLGVWLAAGLRKVESLAQEAREGQDQRRGQSLQAFETLSESGIREAIKKPPTDIPAEVLPLIGFTVVGHEWSMYVGYKNPGVKAMVHIIGPWHQFSASTSDMQGVFKLLRVVERLKAWGHDVYWPWLRKEVLDPLMLVPRKDWDDED